MSRCRPGPGESVRRRHGPGGSKRGPGLRFQGAPCGGGGTAALSRVARVLADRRLQPAARARTRLPGPGPARPRTQRRGRLGHALRPRNLKGSSASDATAHARLGDCQDWRCALRHDIEGVLTWDPDWRCGLRLALPSKRFHEISRVASMAAARLRALGACTCCLCWGACGAAGLLPVRRLHRRLRLAQGPAPPPNPA